MTQIVTRFAPSPTGLLHAGNYRTAVFSYLFARQRGGKFILRIEDTDKERSKKEYEDNILESLKWLGLDYDEFHRQSERAPAHKKYLKQLIDGGFAYVSKEEAAGEGDDKARRKEVIRFKNPNIKVKFHDLIRGEIEVDTTDLKDFVIAKDLDTPLFHLAVVADDFDMGVTHVVRGEDHISNTPRQILIQRAIGAPEPVYAHIPLILAPDRTKLSKRKGALALTEYRDRGYLPQAVLNYLALLGWNPGTEQEILSLDDLLKQFDISKVQKGGAIFNEEKLRWINKEYLKLLSAERAGEEVLARLPENLREEAKKNPELFKKITAIILERVNTLGEITDIANGGEVGYFFEDPTYVKEALFWKDDKDAGHTRTHLDKVAELLQKISPADFTADTVKAALWDYATEVGRGNVLWPLRYALSGRDKSPDPFMLAGILGKETTLRRIERAQQILSA
ncbi:MAG: glutamate--tRNA ligase [Candidatus Yonathbacteria bacterium RIFCSPLOWO2_01_FULL_47_33b]|uniref:Glutamate--tRNA ligase n=1 Tax=Candidatus Yonathbacteria bacterium RIFCSPLOWO2_01_FULL_47_33b TaxID=1802727 RepID=A0A1G2SG69_9BACT|nr:MAG: glutamate--tRNA ligase [Candidatus Yonathbacteria bacterium RIFCSPLOWO2_01_FULL_47_33b]